MPTRPRTVNQRFEQGAATALPDLVELQIGDQIVLLGRCIAVGLPRELCRREAPHAFLRDIFAAPEAVSKLRRFWSQYRSSQETARASDHDLLRAVGGALETGELQAIVFRRASRSTMIDGPSGRSIAPVPPSSSGSASPAQPRSFAAPGQLPGTPVQIAGMPGQSRPVGRWSTEERAAEVIRRAVPKVVAEVSRRAVPKLSGDQGEALLSLLTKENVAIVVETIGFGAVANLTPYDWAADPSLLGVAYAFGGLMAIHFGGLMGILALGDLVDCLELISSAKSDQDLDSAADALACAVVALGVAGVMTVLHRVKERAATRSASGAAAGSANYPNAQWNWKDFAVAVGIGAATAGLGRYVGGRYAQWKESRVAPSKPVPTESEAAELRAVSDRPCVGEPIDPVTGEVCIERLTSICLARWSWC